MKTVVKIRESVLRATNDKTQSPSYKAIWRRRQRKLITGHFTNYYKSHTIHMVSGKLLITTIIMKLQSNHNLLTDAHSSFCGTKASGVVMHVTCRGIEKGSHLLSSSHWHTASGQGTTPFSPTSLTTARKEHFAIGHEASSHVTDPKVGKSLEPRDGESDGFDCDGTLAYHVRLGELASIFSKARRSFLHSESREVPLMHELSSPA